MPRRRWRIVTSLALVRLGIVALSGLWRNVNALPSGARSRNVWRHGTRSHGPVREASLVRLVGRLSATRRVLRPPATLILAAFALTIWPGSASHVRAQEVSGSDGATVAGAALGLYAGAALGGLSAIIPCNQTMAGISCVRAVATIGAGIGLASGLTLGGQDADAVWHAYERAGVGLVAGSVAVLALKPFVDRWSWGDVGAGAVIGSSIGAGGSGAWIGLVIGTGVGVGLWQLIPSVELPDAVGLGLIGMAAGGFTSWIIRAVNAGDESATTDFPLLRFDVGVPW